jgi:hypothetical protein
MKTLLKISLVTMIASSSLLAAPKWIDPPRKNCTSNGGKLGKSGVCEATWDNATAICSSLGAKLPTIEQLRAEVKNCGGVIKDYENNRNNPAYQSCYKNNGFIATKNYYWSYSPCVDDYNNDWVWVVSFSDGSDNAYSKTYSSLIRCVSLVTDSNFNTLK